MEIETASSNNNNKKTKQLTTRINILIRFRLGNGQKYDLVVFDDDEWSQGYFFFVSVCVLIRQTSKIEKKTDKRLQYIITR